MVHVDFFFAARFAVVPFLLVTTVPAVHAATPMAGHHQEETNQNENEKPVFGQKSHGSPLAPNRSSHWDATHCGRAVCPLHAAEDCIPVLGRSHPPPRPPERARRTG